MLPAQVLERGIGIEFGWRHLAGCDCDRCRSGEWSVTRQRAA